MQLFIKKKIGNTVHTFVVEGKNLFELVEESQKLSFTNVDKCGRCGYSDLALTSHVAQGKYKYVEIRCNHCRAQVVFGRREDNPEVFFLRRDKDKKLAWEAYNPDAENKPK